MEKTHKYKTLKGLIKNTQQFSLYTFLSERYYHNKTGWGKLKLSDELKKEVYNLFSSVVGDFNIYVSTCGMFERLIISKRFNCEYIAGQDYPSEIRYLKKLLRN